MLADDGITMVTTTAITTPIRSSKIIHNFLHRNVCTEGH
jgi:hypothetical protein